MSAAQRAREAKFFRDALDLSASAAADDNNNSDYHDESLEESKASDDVEAQPRILRQRVKSVQYRQQSNSDGDDADDSPPSTPSSPLSPSPSPPLSSSSSPPENDAEGEVATVVNHRVIRGQLQWRVNWASTWVSTDEYAAYKTNVKKVIQATEHARLVEWKVEWEACDTINWPNIKTYVCLYAGTVTHAYLRYHEDEGPNRIVVYLCKWSNLTTHLWTPANVAKEYLDATTLAQLEEAPLMAPTPTTGKRKKQAGKKRQQNIALPQLWDSFAPNKKRREWQ